MYWRGFKVLEKNKIIVKDPALDWDLFYNIQYIYETSKEYNGLLVHYYNSKMYPVWLLLETYKNRNLGWLKATKSVFNHIILWHHELKITASRFFCFAAALNALQGTC